jgi:hypothetical protein
MQEGKYETTIRVCWYLVSSMNEVGLRNPNPHKIRIVRTEAVMSELGDYMGSIRGKTRGKKSRATVPLKLGSEDICRKN